MVHKIDEADVNYLVIARKDGGERGDDVAQRTLRGGVTRREMTHISRRWARCARHRSGGGVVAGLRAPPRLRVLCVPAALSYPAQLETDLNVRTRSGNGRAKNGGTFPISRRYKAS